MERHYYEAYDDRYRQIHSQELQWFDDGPTPIILKLIHRFSLSKKAKMLELGCGEGRDALRLLCDGYDVLATDISPAAIRFCRSKAPEFADRFQVLDCVAGELEEEFDFIYAVAVIHMLVLDEDRDSFYAFIRNHLSSSGIGLICTMGDGQTERQTDVTTAFDRQERTHQQSGKTVCIANTSCRMVSFDTFAAELTRNGLHILQQGITASEPDFPVLMYAVVKADLPQSKADE